MDLSSAVPEFVPQREKLNKHQTLQKDYKPAQKKATPEYDPNENVKKTNYNANLSVMQILLTSLSYRFLHQE